MLTYCDVCHRETRAEEVFPLGAYFYFEILRDRCIVRCVDCGVYSLYPQLSHDEILRIYTERHQFSVNHIYSNRGKKQFSFFEKWWELYGDDRAYIARESLKRLKLKRHARPARIFEPGCSVGTLLTVYRRIDPDVDVHGVDIDSQARDRASDAIRDAISIGDFMEHTSNERYDIIILQFLLEHSRRPVELLAKAYELLTDEGQLVIATPDIHSIRAVAAGPEWSLLSRPDMVVGHVMLYDPQSLRSLVQNAGFEIENMTHRGEVIDHLPTFVRTSLLRFLGREKNTQRFISNYYLRILWSVLIDAFLSPRLDLGESLYVFATKKK